MGRRKESLKSIIKKNHAFYFLGHFTGLNKSSEMTTGLINHHLLGNSSQAVVAGCQCIGSFKLPVYLQSVLHQMKAVSVSL